jgi:hypothetical protein
MAAACGDAGARVKALAVYGPGIATPTTEGAQDTPCAPHAKYRLARAKRILWVRHIASNISNISLEDREGSRSILDFARAMRVPNRAYCFLVNGDVAVVQKQNVVRIILYENPSDYPGGGQSAVHTGE